MAKQPAIPLKDIMTAIDKKDRGFYNRLSDEQKKAFSAWMMMRYCSSVQGKNAPDYIFMTNEFVNLNFKDIKDPEFQWLLLSSCGSGKIEFHPYIKPPNSRKKKNKLFEFLSTIYPETKAEDIQLLIDINTKEELKDFLKDHGHDDKTIGELIGK